MAAIARAQIDAELPPDTIRNALDSNLDGAEDVGLFDSIVSNAETLCRSHLGSAAASILSSASVTPDAFAEAVLSSVCLVLLRRAKTDKDTVASWEERQKAALAILDDIAAGKRSLQPVAQRPLIVRKPLQFGEGIL